MNKSINPYDSIVLHIPHASDVVHPCFTTFHGKDYSSLFKEAARDLIDYHTDQLFHPIYPMDSISEVSFGLCRILCDVERLPHDPLEAKGLGIVSEIVINPQTGEPFRLKDFPSGEDPHRSVYDEMLGLYMEHQYNLAKALWCHSSNRRRTLLLDCHSFSSRPTVLCPTPPNVDICIGFNDDDTCPPKEVIQTVCRYFKSLGYRVALNKPFSNSKTVDCPVPYHSLMIEVNKRLYMNEDTTAIVRSPFELLRQHITALYKLLLKDPNSSPQCDPFPYYL